MSKTIKQFLKMYLDDFLLLVRDLTDSHCILLLCETKKCNILLISCAQLIINSLLEYKRARTLDLLSVYDVVPMKTLG